jgi:hypothetical protein
MRPLRHVLWIGGPPCSGKTPVADRIARRHGLRRYSADTRTWAHRDRAIRDGHPAAVRWEALSPEARWAVTDDELLELSLNAERGPMIVDDLSRLPTSPLIVAEGAPVPADVLRSGAAERSRVVWLIPTRDVQATRLEERGLPPGPRRLYRLLAEVVEREAREQDVPMLTVDGALGLDGLVAAVEERFGAALAEGPRAETAAERRALLREANEAVAAQIRGYYARPWAEGDAHGTVGTFACECGDRSCDANVEIAVGALSDGPVLAPGHG